MTTQRNEPETNLQQVIQKYWQILVNWKWTTLAVFFVIGLAAALYAFLAPATYASRATIWIEGDPNILPFEGVVQFEPRTSGSLESYFQLFRSRSLISETINKLHDQGDLIFPDLDNEGGNPPDLTDPVLMEKLIEIFDKQTSIQQVRNSNVVEIQFTDKDPRFAMQALNTFLDSYVDMNIRIKFLPSEQATDFLNGQISKVRAEIGESQELLQKYGTEKNIVPLSTAETTYIENLGSLNTALTQAKIERTEREAYYNGIKNAVLGDIPEAMSNPLIQGLRAEYSRLNREYARNLENLRPEYPQMGRLKAELDKARDDLQAETENLKRTAHSQYIAALRTEQSLEAQFEKLKAEASDLNSDYVIYSSLRNEIANKGALLEALIQRQNEISLSADLKDISSSNIFIVDRASLPLEPIAPKKKQLILIGLLVGLAGGISLAYILEHLNNSIKTTSDVEKVAGLSTLGTIVSLNSGTTKNKGVRYEFNNLRSVLLNPFTGPGRTHLEKKDSSHRKIDKGKPSGEGQAQEATNHRDRIELIVQHEPDSIQAENFRSIRTTLAISSPPGKIKTILFTSPLAQEGKSSIVSNLGLSLSQANNRVVIVDSDLRKPRQGDIFGVKKEDGLSNFLNSHVDWLDLVKPTAFPNLYVINSGPTPANPIELLSSGKMDDLVAFLRRSFDYVLFDAPPILVVSDAIALGPMIDAVILVAWGGKTPTQAFKQAKQKLDTHRLKCLGAILNDVGPHSSDGYYAQHYYKYYRK